MGSLEAINVIAYFPYDALTKVDKKEIFAKSTNGAAIVFSKKFLQKIAGLNIFNDDEIVFINSFPCHEPDAASTAVDYLMENIRQCPSSKLESMSPCQVRLNRPARAPGVGSTHRLKAETGRNVTQLVCAASS